MHSLIPRLCVGGRDSAWCPHRAWVLGAEVTGMNAYSNAEPFPLAWGEVIPMHFISPFLPESTRTLILSHPLREGKPVQMIPELLSLGADLYGFLEPLKERVVVVISADLAHTHLSTGPYGYSNASQPFDQAVGDWASTLNGTSLLVTAASYAERAESCGYTGLVMLHGLMEAQGLEFWKSQLYANFHPTYFGMMVATFMQ